jgi:hypothetical protein
MSAVMLQSQMKPYSLMNSNRVHRDLRVYSILAPLRQMMFGSEAPPPTPPFQLHPGHRNVQNGSLNPTLRADPVETSPRIPHREVAGISTG